MTYQGSKDKYANRIVPLLNQFRQVGQVYWEPFLGSGSIMQHMTGPRIGTDVMTDLIMLWQEVINNTFLEPAYITKEQYDDLMTSTEPSALRAYAGFFWSFSGMFNKGYSPEFFEQSHSFHKMRLRAKKLQGVTLRSTDYRSIGSRGMLIYADPPYFGTTSYRGAPAFNHKQFYEWCAIKVLAENTLIISEYWMPTSFIQIAEFPATTSLGVSKRDKRKSECLYMLAPEQAELMIDRTPTDPASMLK
jgi:site-specific DNA-adenine methylase